MEVLEYVLNEYNLFKMFEVKILQTRIIIIQLISKLWRLIIHQ